ncbi:MAG: hypothetical protein ACLSIL_17575 [Enterococcus casseliflavus]
MIVDIRKGSLPMGNGKEYLLSEYNHRQLLVPRRLCAWFCDTDSRCELPLQMR